MKRIIPTILLIFLTVIYVLGQAPQAINYQAVARDTPGAILTNQDISVKMTILTDSIGGTVKYQEIHNVEVNSYGFINLAFGTGTVISRNFSEIGWDTSEHYLKVEIDPMANGNFADFGTSQILSVPYALEAKHASSLTLTGENGNKTNIKVDSIGNVVTELSQSNDSINVRVIFFFNPQNVVLHLWDPCCQDLIMIENEPNEFSSLLTNINDRLLFNISFDIPEYSIDNWWIGAGNSYTDTLVPNRFDPHGLKYGKIYINNQLIDNSYTIKNSDNNGLNISVKINNDNSIIPLYDESHIHLKIDDRIPQEVHHHNAYRNINVPYSDDNDINGWVIALTDNNILDSCKIEVDYVRLYGRINDNLILFVENEYNTYSSLNDGGLYLRYPFFPPGYDQHDPMPGTVSNSILTFYPSQNIRKVWHWWTPHYISTNGFDYDSYRMECRLRIFGHALVQAGVDFRDENNHIHELGVSDWYFENNGAWQDVVFDTKSINMSTLKLKKPDNKLLLSYVKSENSLHLNYSDMTPGNYRFQLFNIEGQCLTKINVYLKSQSGEVLIPVHILKDSILVYCLSNRHLTFNGKVLIR